MQNKVRNKEDRLVYIGVSKNQLMAFEMSLAGDRYVPTACITLVKDRNVPANIEKFADEYLRMYSSGVDETVDAVFGDKARNNFCDMEHNGLIVAYLDPYGRYESQKRKKTYGFTDYSKGVNDVYPLFRRFVDNVSLKTNSF